MPTQYIDGSTTLDSVLAAACVARHLSDHGRLVCRKLADYHLCAYASKAYLLAAAPIASLTDLRSHQFINYTGDLIFSSYFDYLELILPDVDARFQSSSMITQLHATIKGIGICVLPHFLAGTHPSLVPVLPSETSLVRSWYLVYREDSKNLARIRVISDYLIREFAKIKRLLTGSSSVGEFSVPSPKAPISHVDNGFGQGGSGVVKNHPAR